MYLNSNTTERKDDSAVEEEELNTKSERILVDSLELKLLRAICVLLLVVTRRYGIYALQWVVLYPY